jgi:hypothetical protein
MGAGWLDGKSGRAVAFRTLFYAGAPALGEWQFRTTVAAGVAGPFAYSALARVSIPLFRVSAVESLLADRRKGLGARG